MATASARRLSLAGKVAITQRRYPDSPELPVLRAELAAERIAELVRQAPPLTDGQKSRLAALLFAPAGGAK